MNGMIDELKREVTSRGLEPAGEEVSQLLLHEACEQCCSGHSGGNGDCPPPKTELAT